jgi:hypothetical protein
MAGDHDPAHARLPFPGVFQLPGSGILVDHAGLDHSRELRRRHRRRFREHSYASHLLVLLSMGFSCLLPLSAFGCAPS